ncbi:MAG: LamG-like jellyroll fold domain-containing protein [Pseudomonadota bacterium]
MAYTYYFDPSNPDTPEGLSPVISSADVSGVPSSGTGLMGAAFVTGSSIWNIQKAKEATETEAVATFVATEVSYGARKSDTTIEEFLGDDGASVQGNGDAEMGPSALTLNGYIYIPPGVHEISVVSDDGFELEIGGVPFSDFQNGRAADETSRVAEFEGGLYEIDMLYFDGGGSMVLSLEIDGLPVDQSAFYQDPQDFTNPPADVPLVPAEDYHPSFFLGEDSLETPVTETTSDARDVIHGNGADDEINGLGGDDELYGGYGDDILRGGDGNDVLDGGRGSDVLEGGAGDDILVSRSDAGEQKIGQILLNQITRPDPDGEVDPELDKLSVYADQALKADDVLIGGEGRDTFLITPLINGKLDIIEKHVQSDGTINWAGVAGENDELHDHWVDSFGIDIIADYNAEDDHIAVIGHTAVPYVTYSDVNGDGVEESIINVISVQHGNGGAHDRDLIGQAIVFGDRVDVDDIETDDGVTYGVVENFEDVIEALHPDGEEKITVVDGEEIKGYDTREPMQMNGGDGGGHGGHGGVGTNVLGAVTGDPFNAFDNDNFDISMVSGPSDEEEALEPTRAPFDQLGTEEVDGQVITGNNTSESLSPEEPADPDGLPGALGYWGFDNGSEGAYSDQTANGGGDVKSYTLYENQALLNTGATTEGPGGPGTEALYFNGEDSFAFLEHEQSMNITQGTIAMWVRPDDLGETSAFVAKDHRGAEDGGHFRLGHTKDGGLFLRMAEGDGGQNHTWETDAILTEGEWQHVAVNFGADGVTVFLDGQAVPNNAWSATEGNVATPGAYQEAYLLANDEPWVFGADQKITELNDTAQEFATDREELVNEYEGGIAGFGVWGGYSPEDVLTPAEINQLINDGPGAALTNPAGPQPILAGDDTIDGEGGNDTIDGGAGDDELNGGAGNDYIQGGYGDDMVSGGAGNDTVDGGWGSDLVMGGDGDDVILSRADVGEDRAGQLVLDDPSRPSKSIDDEYLKLFDWIDQPLVGDDVLVGGAGNDIFQIETLINGTRESILDNTMGDGRNIHWHGVAGENQFVHDHWVDGIGIDVIADYNADEDTISVKGHTTQVEVDYATIDTDGDGINDDAVSIVTIYSQQGNGGGAHDEDYLGYLVVHGDRVEEDDIITDPGVHYGVVDTIDELQTAFAPTGDTKYTDLDGDGVAEHLGYDTRDVDGDPIGSDPEAFSSNYWLNNGLVDLDRAVDEDLEAPAVLLEHDGGSFGGPGQPIEIPHDAAQAAAEGTWAFAFTAYNPGNDQEQALFSKDHSGFETGGHLTAYITRNGTLKVRYQGENDQKYLFDNDVRIEAGEQYHMAFTFDEDEISLYLNGELVDTDTGFPGGMTGNEEDLVLGASTRTRQGEDDNLQWHFDGEIENLLLLDRPISELEAVFLSDANGDIDALAALYGLETEPEEEEPVEEEPVEEEPVEETPEEEEPTEEEPQEEEPAEEEPEEEEPEEEEPAEEEPEEEEPEEEEPAEEEPEEEEPAEEEPEEEEPAEEEPEEEEPAEEELEEEEPTEEEPEEEEPTEEEPEEEEPAEEEPEEEEPAEEEPEEEVSDFEEMVARIVTFILKLFGVDEDDEEEDLPQVTEDQVDELETLLSDILPDTGEPEDMQDNVDDSEDDDVDLLV